MSIPTGHYREGRLGTVDLAVIHTTEADASALDVAAYFAGTDRKVSAHAVVDERRRVELLPYSDTAFAAPGANADGDQLEVVGFARWTRADWLKRPGTLDQAGLWLAERCRARALPAVLLTPDQLRANRRGITGHAQVSAAFHLSTHTDPGAGWPWDLVLARVKGHLTRWARQGTTRAPVPTVTVPPYPGHVLALGSRGTAVARWQRQMRRRGWRITVDGVFGPASKAVALAFQRDKHLTADGVVGPVTWRASWAAPVT